MPPQLAGIFVVRNSAQISLHLELGDIGRRANVFDKKLRLRSFWL